MSNGICFDTRNSTKAGSPSAIPRVVIRNVAVNVRILKKPSRVFDESRDCSGVTHVPCCRFDRGPQATIPNNQKPRSREVLENLRHAPDQIDHSGDLAAVLQWANEGQDRKRALKVVQASPSSGFIGCDRHNWCRGLQNPQVASKEECMTQLGELS